MRTPLLNAVIAAVMAWPYPRVLVPVDRLTKTIYLIDWRHAIRFGHTATAVEWIYGEYGPWSDEILDEIRLDGRHYTIIPRNTILKRPQFDIQYNGAAQVFIPPLTMSVIDEVMQITHPMDWGEFLEFVYSTYPVASQMRNSSLDLGMLAPKRKMLSR